jgi:hypothetical protein
MAAYGQFCPVAKAMELLDERWTMGPGAKSGHTGDPRTLPRRTQAATLVPHSVDHRCHTAAGFEPRSVT